MLWNNNNGEWVIKIALEINKGETTVKIGKMVIKNLLQMVKTYQIWALSSSLACVSF